MYWRMAATALVLVTAGLATYLNRSSIRDVVDPVVYVTAETAAGSVRQVELADGTQLWLNAGTSVRYPERFNRETREIFVDGEAFLNVKKNSEMPFIVHLSKVNVQVTGTSFQVKDYTDDDRTTITLRSGSVTVRASGRGDSTNSVLGHLAPDQQLVFHKNTNGIERHTVDAQNNFHWTRGALRFENMALREIMEALGHWYGVQFVLGPELAECRFKMDLTGLPLNDALPVIAELSNTKYVRHGQTIQFIGKGCK